MASFIPNHRKKFVRLRRVENALRRLIARGAEEEELLNAAAEVRECRIRVLRARQNKNPERTHEERALFLKWQGQIKELKAVSARAILAEFTG